MKGLEGQIQFYIKRKDVKLETAENIFDEYNKLFNISEEQLMEIHAEFGSQISENRELRKKNYAHKLSQMSRFFDRVISLDSSQISTAKSEVYLVTFIS